MRDPYLYDDADVLKNRANIKDSIADLTNLSADRGSFYVPVEVTQAPVSITMTYQSEIGRASCRERV